MRKTDAEWFAWTEACSDVDAMWKRARVVALADAEWKAALDKALTERKETG